MATSLKIKDLVFLIASHFFLSNGRAALFNMVEQDHVEEFQTAHGPYSNRTSSFGWYTYGDVSHTQAPWLRDKVNHVVRFGSRFGILYTHLGVEVRDGAHHYDTVWVKMTGTQKEAIKTMALTRLRSIAEQVTSVSALASKKARLLAEGEQYEANHLVYETDDPLRTICYHKKLGPDLWAQYIALVFGFFSWEEFNKEVEVRMWRLRKVKEGIKPQSAVAVIEYRDQEAELCDGQPCIVGGGQQSFEEYLEDVDVIFTWLHQILDRWEIDSVRVGEFQDELRQTGSVRVSRFDSEDSPNYWEEYKVSIPSNK